MGNQTGRFRQVCADSWVTEKMPDGSLAMFDHQSKNSFFLNAVAASAWEACKDPADVPTIAARMHASEETVVNTLAELQGKGLVDSLEVPEGVMADLQARRRLLKTVGIAAGAVLALSASEQKAHAAVSASTVVVGN